MIQEKHILQTELQGRISDLDLLGTGRLAHRQINCLHGCSDLQYFPLFHMKSPSPPSVNDQNELEDGFSQKKCLAMASRNFKKCMNAKKIQENAISLWLIQHYQLPAWLLCAWCGSCNYRGALSWGPPTSWSLWTPVERSFMQEMKAGGEKKH